MSRPSRRHRLLARALRVTTLIDRAYKRFDRLRARAALSFGSDAFHAAYHDAAYGGDAAYRADSSTFRTALFDWEERAIDRTFPKAPATILIGAAGGGREALALARRGYHVVAFEPNRRLVASLVQTIGADTKIEVLCGRYEDLPVLSTPEDASIDLRVKTRFDAAIFGWASFSHLSSDAARVEALRQVAALTNGPMLVSCFPRADVSRAESAWAFSIHIGRYREIGPDSIRQMTAAAGLTVVPVDDRDTFSAGYFVLRQPR
jgi:hypothetical protein